MSSYLWMRKWKILVVDDQDKEALNVSDLHVKFTVKKSREINNYSTVEIYNLTAATEQKILKEGDRIIIEAGYEGYLTAGADGSVQEAKDAEGNTQEKQYGVIFDGKIIYPSRRKENNTDYVLSLLCVDGANVLGKNFIAKTLNKGRFWMRSAKSQKPKYLRIVLLRAYPGKSCRGVRLFLANLKIIFLILPAVTVRAIG